MANITFGGLCVLALESRRAREIAKLIANLGGVPIVAPSVREVPLESNQEALDFARRLSAGEVDMVIFTTGVGVKALASAVEKAYPRDELSRHLNHIVVVARGPKPTAALRELGVGVSLTVPEPNTWRDLLILLDQSKNTFPVAGRRIAVQEYGVTNSELFAGLQERGAIVTLVNVYQWALPEDLGPLRNAVESIIGGNVQVLLVASSVQIRHLYEVAESMAKRQALQEALARVVITSVGPLTSEELRSRGLTVDIECTRPKMGFLVQEAAEKSAEILRQKRGPHPVGIEDQV
ncbi:MAG: uroporphyrinogen-III synthase [Candidatus Sulfotelmatobacter sp.]|jgi:uroporphyrinogen-III synthase